MSPPPYIDFSDLPGRRRAIERISRADIADGVVDVSIVTPYFNTEDFFIETFVSLQLQTFKNWEWIIVDDGSSDSDSLKRLATVSESDARVKVVRQENSGPAAARNKGFEHSKGRYVCLLDSDDMLEPTYIEKCIWFLESNPEFSFCNTYSIFFGDEQYLCTTGFERGIEHLQANSGPPISVVRREAYVDCGGFDESIKFGHEDWDFWLAMAKSGHWGYTIPEYLQWYRKRSTGRYETIKKAGKVDSEFKVYIKRKYSDLKHNFPTPSLKTQLPFSSIETEATLNNSLHPNKSGRRILFLIPWMVTGGADRVNLDLIEGLTSLGHEVTICATLSTVHNWEYEFRKLTNDVFILPNFISILDYPRFIVYMIVSRGVDAVVVTGSTLGYQLLPYIRSFAPPVTIVDMCHVEEPNWWNGGHPRFGVGYQDLLDLNIVTTQHLSNWMVSKGGDQSKIRVMYTGVRVPHVSELADRNNSIRKELAINSDMPIIVFAGRLCAQKRPQLIIEILADLDRRGVKFKSILIGDGELKADTEDRIKENKLGDSISMLGLVEHGRWLEILSESSILLMPSEYEGISIALQESIASGVVPVVSAVGGQDEIVDFESGYLVPHSDSEVKEYSDILHELLSDPGRLQLMSEKCKEIGASKLSWGGMVNNFLVILDEASSRESVSSIKPLPTRLTLEITSSALELARMNSVFQVQLGGFTGKFSSVAEYKVAEFFVRIYRMDFFQSLSRIMFVRKIFGSIRRRLK